MFGMLKKKFKGFAEKVFGKSEEKVKDSLKDSKEILDNNFKSENLVKDLQNKSNIETIQNKNILEKSDENILNKEKPLFLGHEANDSQNNNINIINNNVKSNKSISIKNISEEEKIKSDVEEEKIKSDVEEDLIQNQNLSRDSNNFLKSEEYIEKQKIKIKKEQDIPPSGHSFTKQELASGFKREIDFSSKEYQDLSFKKQDSIKTGISSSLKSLFSSKIKLSESDISFFLEDFELSLLEADVSINASQAIVNSLKEQLKSASFSKKNLMEDIKNVIKESLLLELDIDCDFNKFIPKNLQEPLIILFVGPNGAGKTTTIAKFAKKFKDNGKKIILSSSDTFRAGSIDQLQEHANRIGVKIIKQNYGSDPAAVAFDTVTSAKANNYDIVLIDTAGRQDTNSNLLRELEKIKRVIKPHITIYIGESQTGQSIVDQISKFDSEIGLDGIILTKIDTDPKGGVAISILNELKKPIFFIGTGQNYNDLEDFSASYIVNRII
ncbi:MAG: signal recognition particle-docking protein FtsY [Candidatus ainarchaeum sp.]|nr:signal recognition particle-docking protein FtsY [Candidatus ainarchaeum sp.]MDD3976161.1 signal recognition particle-docking protein FtsY [Candidatus ainarchaeum sp.]